ncbi:hypothetical protein SLS60_008673 [Paraconiothyrium brasiliense]|uniref:Uncharacterized protein n=1 Tax=Paraconiothyrium brasiliense TaxID=300254 RepID=A0ABR3QY56_9PLEO
MAQAQIIDTTTYDGGISYNILSRDTSRENHVSASLHIAQDIYRTAHAKQLCDIYSLSPGTQDNDAPQRICLFESDIEFFAAVLAMAEANLVPKTYFHVFDLLIPFDRQLRKNGKFATHTFDVVTLLDGVLEDRLPGSYAPAIQA